MFAHTRAGVASLARAADEVVIAAEYNYDRREDFRNDVLHVEIEVRENRVSEAERHLSGTSRTKPRVGPDTPAS
jgi:hypothetical protein